MRTLTVKIAAGATEEIGATGDYVRVRLAPYDVKIENTQTGEIVEASQGDDFQLSPFTELRITNLGGVDAVFKVTIATGKKAGSAPGVISGTVTVGNNNGAFTQGRASLTNVAQTLLAANAARRTLTIQNNDGGQALRYTLGGTTPTASAGFRLLPGASVTIQGYACTGAINAIMEAATAATNNIEFVEG